MLLLLLVVVVPGRRLSCGTNQDKWSMHGYLYMCANTQLGYKAYSCQGESSTETILLLLCAEDSKNLLKKKSIIIIILLLLYLICDV